MAETEVRAVSRTPSAEPPCGTVEGWLASAHPSPDTVRGEWRSVAKLALIPLGRAFDAVRLPERVVCRAVGSTDLRTVCGRLADWLDNGPVIHDPGFLRYYALVPPGSTGAWRASSAECLGDGTYLGVPPSDHTGLNHSTKALYWAVPMARPGGLCATVDVLALVTAGGCPTDEGES
ncbi:hypothetical protein ACH4E5_25550 [Streptomyces afghaniensis]|uniref:hypothetical protein n=1 Tax=Streptomyces afghaniensis TaxID=66865 RepID=UPI0037A65C80